MEDSLIGNMLTRYENDAMRDLREKLAPTNETEEINQLSIWQGGRCYFWEFQKRNRRHILNCIHNYIDKSGAEYSMNRLHLDKIYQTESLGTLLQQGLCMVNSACEKLKGEGSFVFVVSIPLIELNEVMVTFYKKRDGEDIIGKDLNSFEESAVMLIEYSE